MKIINAKVFIDGKYHDNLEVRFDHEKILEIGKNLNDDEIIDAQGNILYAGIIDTHCHGGWLKGFNYTTAFKNSGTHIEQVKGILKKLPETGVTTVYPTLAGIAPARKDYYEDITECIRNIRQIKKEKSYEGAEPLKIHLEHTYPTLDRYLDEGVVKPTIAHTDKLVDYDYSDIGFIGVAPDQPNIEEYLDYLISKGVQPETGYTKATVEQTIKAADHGLCQASHLYNGYLPMHHRESSPALGVLLDNRIKAQLTLDGYHVNPAWIRLTLKVKGIENCYGITDLSGFSGLPEGKNIMDDGSVVLTHDGFNWRPDGHIKTGNMVMNEIMLCAKQKVGLSMEEIGTLFCENPAKCSRIEDRGKIEVGRKSDFVIMSENFEVIKTLINGEVYYEK